jgi:two-component system response regulator MprA
MSAHVVPKRILVVDDERTIRELVAETLLDAGYSVETASDGAKAWRTMTACPPDALVLDLMMPELNARDLLRLMGADPRFHDMPFVLVTAAYDAAAEAAKLGARAWLSKPFALEDLIAALENLVETPALA